MDIIDANIVLRYILNDHEELSPKAAEIIETGQVLLPLEAACEVVFVLLKVYRVERTDIHSQLHELVTEEIIQIEKRDVFLAALSFFAKTAFDFVDTTLWAYASLEGKNVVTFDKKLAKAIDRSRA